MNYFRDAFLLHIFMTDGRRLIIFIYKRKIQKVMNDFWLLVVNFEVWDFYV